MIIDYIKLIENNVTQSKNYVEFDGMGRDCPADSLDEEVNNKNQYERTSRQQVNYFYITKTNFDSYAFLKLIGTLSK